MLASMHAAVERFNREILHVAPPDSPAPLSPERARAKARHLEEELKEFEEACDRRDLAAQADAIVDLLYVGIGAMIEMGVVGPALFEAVHEANMRKQHGRVAKRPGDAHDAVKPPGWKPADLLPYLTLGKADLDRMVRLKAASPNLLKLVDSAVGIGPPVNGLTGVPEDVKKNPTAGDARESYHPTHGDPPGEVKLAPGGGMLKKETKGKPPMSRMPYEGMAAIAAQFELGGTKYTWGGYKRQGPTVLEMLDAIVRHAVEMANGNTYDVNPATGLADAKYSGIRHTGGIGCNVMMLEWTMANKPENDDRADFANRPMRPGPMRVDYEWRPGTTPPAQGVTA